MTLLEAFPGPHCSACKERIIPAFNGVSLIPQPVSCPVDYVITRVYCIKEMKEANYINK